MNRPGVDNLESKVNRFIDYLRNNRRLQLVLGAAALLVAVLLVAFFVYVGGEGADPEAEGVARITVPKGASAWRVGYLLRDEGLIESPRRWVWYLRWRGNSEDLKSGTYDIPRAASMAFMAKKILAGDEVMVEVTLPEGWTSSRMAGEYRRIGVCDSVEFMRAVNDAGLVRELLGLEDVASLEGFLYPETYRFRLNLPGGEVARSMVALFKEKVGQEWLASARRHKLGLHGVVTLASIVQGEFQDSTEAPDIAALYQNRLDRGMKLQADPTVQYIVPGEPRRLLYQHLRIDSPYNTYKYRGLPPGPINNPSVEALKAALNPPERPWLYMVAYGDGTHTFTTNYQDHLQAKKRLDAIRRQVARKQRNSP